MSRTFPGAAGAIPRKLVSRMTLIAGAKDTECFSRRMSEDSSAESCERQVIVRWISVQNFFRMLRQCRKHCAITMVAKDRRLFAGDAAAERFLASLGMRIVGVDRTELGSGGCGGLALWRGRFFAFPANAYDL